MYKVSLFVFSPLKRIVQFYINEKKWIFIFFFIKIEFISEFLFPCTGYRYGGTLFSPPAAAPRRCRLAHHSRPPLPSKNPSFNGLIWIYPSSLPFKFSEGWFLSLLRSFSMLNSILEYLEYLHFYDLLKPNIAVM